MKNFLLNFMMSVAFGIMVAFFWFCSQKYGSILYLIPIPFCFAGAFYGFLEEDDEIFRPLEKVWIKTYKESESDPIVVEMAIPVRDEFKISALASVMATIDALSVDGSEIDLNRNVATDEHYHIAKLALEILRGKKSLSQETRPDPSIALKKGG